ncbi:16S rRNA (guanine(966)-N(2))-methyltransferase RsmD [Petrotoga sp. 9PWA.NaAc.5.4]|uniref:16S rRNA (guanine(966)-N(2))-methyltransferase RsmD n=1 Tax=Petrotoga sp. 9PWA.NaAc.5.4 TaxID=1434328 RepID=UPI000CC56A72|nr:16S rRNA (guanine(966)-N(2))-methyltransferase RsmD [Petrotoga sp. 9PWA.NaAc.5.4]PNR92452.1 methyltransferase [Petrotoga sp. 9PWA.NaAc.5.4]
MILKIETGKFKNKIIHTVSDYRTRYTTASLRQAIMSMFDFSNVDILELFAGSGIFSFEALSNGAKSATLVDISSKAINTILENAKELNILESIKVIKSDFRRVINKLKDYSYDCIYADPPFNLGYVDDLIKIIDNSCDILKNDGIMFIEKHKKEKNNFSLKNMFLEEVREYGDVELIILKKKVLF